MALHDSSIGHTSILDDTEVAMLLAVFLAGCRAQKHCGHYADCQRFEKGRVCSTTAQFAVFQYLYPCYSKHLNPSKLFFRFRIREVGLVNVFLAWDTSLMERYSNVPMDYAHATLVAPGEELETDWVFTLDRRGFGVYRLGQRKAFQIIP